MKTLLALTLLTAAEPAFSVPGGKLDTLPLGRYACELPGDIEGPSGIPVPEDGFTVSNASSYRTAQGEGIYLLVGDTVSMTSGPLRNARYHRISEKFLRKMAEDGSDSKVRCILRMANNDRSNGLGKGYR